VPCPAPHLRAWLHAAAAARSSTGSNGSGLSGASTRATGRQTAVEAVPPAPQPKTSTGKGRGSARVVDLILFVCEQLATVSHLEFNHTQL